MPTTADSLADRLHAQEVLGASRPAEIASVFADERAGLAADGPPAVLVELGNPMPDGDLLDIDGKPTSLEQIRDRRAAVVVFYRGAWCPYCNIALKVYQDELVPALTKRGVALIAVSPQKPDGSLAAKDKHALTYDVVSDPGNQIAAQLGILTGPTAAVLELQLRFGTDLSEINADGTTTLPMPTVTIVDADGRLRWIDVCANYATRTDPVDILAALTALDRP